jgi:hypothetical protein
VLLKIIIWTLGIAIVIGMPSRLPGAARNDECFFGCPEDGRNYRDSLLAAIDRADQIVVTEHSSPWDAFDIKTHRSRIEGEYEYGRVTLTDAQKAEFRETIGAVSVATQSWASACIPEFHHTVRFFEGGALKSTLQICFQCSQVEWDAIQGVSPPGAIYDTLEKAISSVGLNPKRDWKRLAGERLAAQ